MIELLGKGKDLEHRYHSSCKADYIIKDLEQNGFQAEYVEEEWSVIIYPNYKEADEIACNWVGAPTMTDFTPDHKYLEKD